MCLGSTSLGVVGLIFLIALIFFPLHPNSSCSTRFQTPCTAESIKLQREWTCQPPTVHHKESEQATLAVFRVGTIAPLSRTSSFLSLRFPLIIPCVLSLFFPSSPSISLSPYTLTHPLFTLTLMKALADPHPAGTHSSSPTKHPSDTLTDLHGLELRGKRLNRDRLYLPEREKEKKEAMKGSKSKQNSLGYASSHPISFPPILL